MDFSKKYQKAEEAYKKRNYDYAVEIYLSILQMDPNEMKARNSMRAILVKKKEEGTYKPSGRMGQMGFSAKLKTLQMKKSWEQVIAECDRQLTTDMDNPAVLKALGNALMVTEHWDAAVAVFESVRQLATRDPEVYRSLGTIFQKTGDLEKAKKFWEVTLQLLPTDADATRNVRDLNAQITSNVWSKGDDYRDKMRDKKVSEALEEDQHIIRTDEDIVKALGRVDEVLKDEDGTTPPAALAKLWRKKAELHERQRDYDKARVAYEKQLEFAPDAYDAPDKIGDLQLKVLEEQIADLKEAVKSNPDKQSELEQVQRTQQQTQIHEYGRRVQAHPTDLRHRFDLGRAYLRSGELDKAIENLQQTVNDGKLEVNSLLLLAQAFGRKGLHDFAKRQCERALATTDGRKNDIWKAATYTLGDICERAEDFEQALHNYEQLYSIDISYRDVGQRYENLRRRLEKKKPEEN